MVRFIEGEGCYCKRDKKSKSGARSLISDYFKEVELRIINAEIVADKKVNYSEFSPDEGMLRGRLLFVDGSTLEFMEYLQRDRRLKYRFHLIDKNGRMVFRYDNAPHHDNSTFPHHKHLVMFHEGFTATG